VGRDASAKSATDLGSPDFDRLFEAYRSTLAAYAEHKRDLFPSTEVRLAIVSSMVAEAARGEMDPSRLAAAGLLAVGLLPDGAPAKGR
jgi:hypothetical protein